MGVSTDAILVYGIDLGEDLPAFADGADDFYFDDMIAAEAGLSREAAGADYWKVRREAVAAYPIDLVHHCYGESPMYILAVRGTETKAYRGSPKEINPVALAVTPEKIATLRDFCSKHGIKWSEPKWLLCSYWSN